MSLTPDQDAARRTDTKQPTALAVVITFTVLAFISVSLRYFTRFITIKNPGWDDYIVGVAMVRESRVQYGITPNNRYSVHQLQWPPA